MIDGHGPIGVVGGSQRRRHISKAPLEEGVVSESVGVEYLSDIAHCGSLLFSAGKHTGSLQSPLRPIRLFHWRTGGIFGRRIPVRGLLQLNLAQAILDRGVGSLAPRGFLGSRRFALAGHHVGLLRRLRWTGSALDRGGRRDGRLWRGGLLWRIRNRFGNNIVFWSEIDRRALSIVSTRIHEVVLATDLPNHRIQRG